MNLPIQFHMNPWTALGAFRDFQRGLHLVNSATQVAQIHRPLVNLSASESQLVITAELPGVNPTDLEVRISDRLLTVRGSFENAVPEGSKTLINERLSGRFERTIRVPEDINEEAISARYDKGVLTVTLPRAAKPEARTIPVLSNQTIPQS